MMCNALGGFCHLYLPMIVLMRSGDVETNPGPERTVHEEEFIKLSKLIEPSYYKEVGVHLKIPNAELDQILAQHMLNFSDALMTVFTRWRNKQQRGTDIRALLAERLERSGLGWLSGELLAGSLVPKWTDGPKSPGNLTSPVLKQAVDRREMIVTEGQLHAVSKNFPHQRFTELSRELGTGYNTAQAILVKHKQDYHKALMEILMDWKNKTGGPYSVLAAALRASGAWDLVVHMEPGTSSSTSDSEEEHAVDISSVSDREFLELAHDISPSYYIDLGVSLGIPYAHIQAILNEKLNNYPSAFVAVFMKWNVMQQPPNANKREVLADKLQENDLGDLSEKLRSGHLLPNITGGPSRPPESQTKPPAESETKPLSPELIEHCPNDEIHLPQNESDSDLEPRVFSELSVPPGILARGPEAIRAYALALKYGKKKVFRTRLMLMGQKGVGKTSLKKSLTRQRFDPTEELTDGAETEDICEISIEHIERDKDDKISWSVKQKGNADDSVGEFKRVLVDSVVSTLQENTSQVGGAESGNDEGKDKATLNIWDFAGHDMYYTTHQVFLTWRAIYVIVFDLSTDLDSVVRPECWNRCYQRAKQGTKSELTCLEFIEFWLYSIYSHAVMPSSKLSKYTIKASQKTPPIFIVGTHREEVKGSEREKEKKIAAAFDRIRIMIKGKPFECHVIPKYYQIENKLETDKELGDLRKHIVKVAKDEPYMGEEIPLKWLRFEEFHATNTKNYMTLDEIREHTQQIGTESEEELLTMLNFYHDLGSIIYYGDVKETESLLRDMVILNPQWLINVFKQVITVLEPEKRAGIVSDAWSTLEKYGILEDRLIQHMWQEFQVHKDALVELMMRSDLICKAPAYWWWQEQTGCETSDKTATSLQKIYYVPSRLPPLCQQKDTSEGDMKSSVEFYIDVHKFLPEGLFHRLMARTVQCQMDRGEQVRLFYRQISMRVDDKHEALLTMLPPSDGAIKVSVFRAEIVSDDEAQSIPETADPQTPDPKAVKEVRDIATKTLDSLIQQLAKNLRYNIGFKCPKCGMMRFFTECFLRKLLPCGHGDHRIPSISLLRTYGYEKEVETLREKLTSTAISGDSVTSNQRQRVAYATISSPYDTSVPSASGASNQCNKMPSASTATSLSGARNVVSREFTPPSHITKPSAKRTLPYSQQQANKKCCIKAEEEVIKLAREEHLIRLDYMKEEHALRMEILFLEKRTAEAKLEEALGCLSQKKDESNLVENS